MAKNPLFGMNFKKVSLDNPDTFKALAGLIVLMNLMVILGVYVYRVVKETISEGLLFSVIAFIWVSFSVLLRIKICLKFI